jgi:hypothetical protein
MVEGLRTEDKPAELSAVSQSHLTPTHTSVCGPRTALLAASDELPGPYRQRRAIQGAGRCATM